MTYASDSFNRANSAAALGTADVGGVWVNRLNAWGISSNQAALNAGTGPAIATLPIAHADCTLDVILNGTDNNPGLTFRWSDASNYWNAFGFNAGANIVLQKTAATVATLPINVAATWVAGSKLRVVLLGNSIDVFVSATPGGALVRVTGSPVTDAFNATATEHGLYAFTGGTGTLDNFLCTA